MTKHKLLKHKITEKVLKEISHSSPYEIDEVVTIWWFSIDGLRLTTQGDLAFRLANIEYYDQEFKHGHIKNIYGFMLDLSKKIKCPYYVGKLTDEKGKPTKGLYIRIYDSKIAMMIRLYGNLHDYLASIKVKKGKTK